ncbi:MAG: sulfite exporter TauE/SafE family protein, partial [Planctomycetes bacterium]|nr:sulfite exporter TauE/SafE family protein [Planctomycetota bacterium]
MFQRKLAPVWVALLVWIAWAIGMQSGQRWHLFEDNYFMSLTMAVGSFIAGATSEGGGAVAFPVMTLGFKIAPGVARDFSLMIQSVGMVAAAATIFFTRIPVLRQSVIWSSVGGAIGVVLAFEGLARWPIPPVYAKMLFTSTWLAFAFALYWINRYHDREVHDHIERFSGRHRVLLASVGVLGGVITSITGSGLDILTFSLLVLRFRISEKIATPTSVILMGFNALFASLYKGGVQHGLDPAAWNYWWV